MLIIALLRSTRLVGCFFLVELSVWLLFMDLFYLSFAECCVISTQLVDAASVLKEIS